VRILSQNKEIGLSPLEREQKRQAAKGIIKDKLKHFGESSESMTKFTNIVDKKFQTQAGLAALSLLTPFDKGVTKEVASGVSSKLTEEMMKRIKFYFEKNNDEIANKILGSKKINGLIEKGDMKNFERVVSKIIYSNQFLDHVNRNSFSKEFLKEYRNNVNEINLIKDDVLNELIPKKHQSALRRKSLGENKTSTRNWSRMKMPQPRRDSSKGILAY
jgi:hypothetical protein